MQVCLPHEHLDREANRSAYPSHVFGVLRMLAAYILVCKRHFCSLLLASFWHVLMSLCLCA